MTASHGKNSQHIQSNKQRRLRDLAGSIPAVLACKLTTLSEIPRCRGGISLVGIIRPNLPVCADGKECNKGKIDADCDDGVPKLHDVRNQLGKQEEERNDGNRHVEIGKAGEEKE